MTIDQKLNKTKTLIAELEAEHVRLHILADEGIDVRAELEEVHDMLHQAHDLEFELLTGLNDNTGVS